MRFLSTDLFEAFRGVGSRRFDGSAPRIFRTPQWSDASAPDAALESLEDVFAPTVSTGVGGARPPRLRARLGGGGGGESLGESSGESFPSSREPSSRTSSARFGSGGFSFRAPSDETRAPSAVSSLGVRVAGVRVGSPSREGRKSARRGWDGQRGPRRVRGRGARSEKNKARTVQVGREKDAAARRGGRSGEGRGPRTTRRSSPKRQAKNASAPGRLATIRGRISARGRRRARARAPRRIGAGSTWQTDRIVQPLGRRARTWSLESRRRARSRCARARRTREKFGASAREVGSGARGGRSRTRGAECEEAPRGKVKKCRPAGRYFPQAGKENSSRVGRNAGSRLVARVRLIRGARTDGRGQVNPPGTRVMDKLDTEPSCVPEGADLSRVATPHHDARVFPSRVAGSMTRDARPPWRVHLSPSTNYERRILEEAFDRCDCPDARARTRTRSIGGHPEGSRRIGVGSSSPRRP